MAREPLLRATRPVPYCVAVSSSSHTAIAQSHVPDESDESLIAQVRAGEARALEQIFRRYSQMLLGAAYRYLAAPDEAEEVVQDLFLWIWEHRSSWTVSGSLRPYLLLATRNRAFNRLRHRRVEHRLTERLQGSSDGGEAVARSRPVDALDVIAGDELSQVVSAAIEALPPRCREVFLGSRRDHLSHHEVAAMLGISTKTVEIHMTRALGGIRAAVARWRGGG